MRRAQVVIATTNQGKVREIAELYANLPVVWTAMSELGTPPVVEESGATYRENARRKAETILRWCGLPTLAEDSGLEVDALDGAPGVRSARFAGEHATDPENVALLLERLRGVPTERRTARFRAVATLWWGVDGPTPQIDEAEGSCQGAIALTPSGTDGFGYDPVFIPEGHDQTFAALGSEVKNRLSHRSRALRGLRTMILKRLDAAPFR